MLRRWPLVGRDVELDSLQQLLRSDRGSRGVAVVGDAGVGKTRLISEVIEGLRADGVAVEWVRATEAARAIPLGSFAHLLTGGAEVHQRDDLLHFALSRLHERAGDRGFLLAVDDAHLLDEVSVALLHLVVTQCDIRVLVSVRMGEPDLPPGLVALWKDELLARLEVRALDREATESLVLAVLGVGVPTSVVDRIWQLSRGNALFVRELVTAAVERRDRGGGARVALAEGTQARLRELVDERLRLLDPAVRAALEIVAVGEQVPLEVAERLAGPDEIEDLERHGLVEVTDADTALVQMAHPIYGQVLAQGLPRSRRRALLRDLVGAVEALEATTQRPPRIDLLRLAIWRLESGMTGDPEDLLALAREAMGRLDHHLAERLARAAGGTDRTDAGLVVGEALSGQGRIAEAQAVLANLRPTDPAEVARIAIARAGELFLHLDRSNDAFDVLRAADADLDGHPVWQAECRSVLAQMFMFSLRLNEAGEMADNVLGSPDSGEPARVRAATVAATALGSSGRLDRALALLGTDLQDSAVRHRHDVPYGDLQLRMARFQTLYWGGRVRELDDYTALNLGLDVSFPPPALRGILSEFRGAALLLLGRANEALAELQRASRALTESDWFGHRPLAEAMLARAAVFAGDIAVAEQAIRVADEAYLADTLRGASSRPYVELSRSWLMAAQGQVAEAADRCLMLAAAMEHVTKPLAVEILHAAVRLGGAADAVDRMERLVDAVDGPYAELALRHTRALTNHDADELAAVAGSFVDLGADLLAAEAYRSAANAYSRDGRGASASSSARRVDELLAACGSPGSPALERVVPAGEDLTDREREVARLAASGRTSPEIAEALFLSVRTVDTHLHRVYRKLSIEGRHQLAEAIGVLPQQVAEEHDRASVRQLAKPIGAIRVGDVFSHSGGLVEVTGFVLGMDHQTPGARSADYALLRLQDGTEALRETGGLVTPTYRHEAQGSDPFNGVPGWKLSPAWVQRFNTLLEPLAQEPNLVEPASRLAHSQGETVLVTGGVLRDALLGLEREAGTIDLVGTLRSPSFQDLATSAMLESLGGDTGAASEPWRIRTTGSERFVHVFSSDEQHAVDYAPMRIDYRPHMLSTAPVWIYGTSLEADFKWRDASCNALVYDPRTGWLYDPTEDGLRDLGLKPSDLAKEPSATNPRHMTLRPVDLPTTAPARHVARHVVRVVQLVLRFANSELDLRPAQQWAARHAAVVEQALDHRDFDGDRYPLITKELRSLPRAADLIELIRRHEDVLAATFAADNLWPKLRAVLPTPAMLRSGGSQGQRPEVLGSALRMVVYLHGRWTAAPGVLGPSRPTRAAATRYFGEELAGYERASEKVEVDGMAVSGVSVLRPAGGYDGVHYMELDDSLEPVIYSPKSQPIRAC